MTMRKAKVDGFKFSVHGIKQEKTVKGESYDIPDHLYEVWTECGNFEKDSAPQARKADNTKLSNKSMSDASDNK